MRIKKLLAGVLVGVAVMSFMPSYAAGEDPVLVGEDPIDNPIDPEAQAVWNTAGLDIREMYIHRPDFAVDAIEFIIQLEDLESPPPGEVIRYLWSFTADGVEYGLNAKVTDVVSVVTPTSAVETVEHAAAGSSFRLRTGCLVTQIATCQHLLWLDGTFDVDADQVRFTVPLGNPAAPEIAEGATIVGLADGVNASIQAFVSNSSTSDTATPDEDYIVPTT